MMMYNYYFCAEPQKNVQVTFATPTLGQQASGNVLISGAIVSTQELSDIRAIDIFQATSSADLTLTLTVSSSIHQPTQYRYSFDLSIDANNITDDLHFSLIANTVGEPLTLGSGFVQQVEPVEQVVLIVGSPRSGTTAVGKALRNAINANAHGESHVIEGIQHILNTCQDFFIDSGVAQIKNNLVNVTPYTVLLAEQLNVLRNLYRLNYGSQVHLDKTPGIPMLKSLPIALIAWPNAKVIFCKRRALENVHSRLIKFPKVPFEGHLKQWKQSFVVWRRSRQQINQMLKNNKWAMEVEQEQMANSPEVIANALQQHLALQSTSKNKLIKSLKGRRPEQTSTPNKRTRSLKEMGWTAQQQQLVYEVCGDELKRQGYSLDSGYYLNSNVSPKSSTEQQ